MIAAAGSLIPFEATVAVFSAVAGSPAPEFTGFLMELLTIQPETSSAEAGSNVLFFSKNEQPARVEQREEDQTNPDASFFPLSLFTLAAPVLRAAFGVFSPGTESNQSAAAELQARSAVISEAALQPAVQETPEAEPIIHQAPAVPRLPNDDATAVEAPLAFGLRLTSMADDERAVQPAPTRTASGEAPNPRTIQVRSSPENIPSKESAGTIGLVAGPVRREIAPDATPLDTPQLDSPPLAPREQTITRAENAGAQGERVSATKETPVHTEPLVMPTGKDHSVRQPEAPQLDSPPLAPREQINMRPQTAGAQGEQLRATKEPRKDHPERRLEGSAREEPEPWRTPEDHSEPQMESGQRDSSESDERLPAHAFSSRRAVSPPQAARSTSGATAPIQVSPAFRTAEDHATPLARPASTTTAELAPEIPAPSITRPIQLREIRMIISPTRANPEPVALRLTERHGEVVVDVRTHDRSFSGDLRSNLPVLIERLENAGLQAEAWRPGAPAAQPETPRATPFAADHHWSNAEGQSGRQQSGHRQNQEQRHKHREQPAWMAELDRQNRKWGNA